MKQSTVNEISSLWQRCAVFVLALLVLGSTPACARQITSEVSFTQVSITDPHAPQRYSHVGRISIDFSLLSGEGLSDGYINVERYVDGKAAGWVVRNLRVIGGFVQSESSTAFHLGASGHQLIYSAYVDFSPTPLLDDASLNNQVPATYTLDQVASPTPVVAEEAVSDFNSAAVTAAVEETATSHAQPAAAAAAKITYTFQLLVDTSIMMPPANKVKFSDFSAPAISVTPAMVAGGPPTVKVAYRGIGKNAQGALALAGVYVSDPAMAPPVRVVDTTKKAPGAGFFLNFPNAPDIQGDVVAFFAVGLMGSGQTGLYTSAPNYAAYTAIADNTTAIPGGNGNFTAFIAFPAPSISANNLAFHGLGDKQGGIYFGTAGALSKIADTTTDSPAGNGKFSTFGNPSLSAGKIAFRGTVGLGQNGIYIGAKGAALVTLADKTVKCPQNNGMNFSGADNPSISGGIVAIRGMGCPVRGIFTGTPGALTLVADETVNIPDGMGKFNNAGWPSQSGTNVAFQGWGTKQQGIYLSVNGALQTVVDLNTKLNGNTPVGFDFLRSGLDGTHVAFKVMFSDGSIAIYLAIPK